MCLQSNLELFSGSPPPPHPPSPSLLTPLNMQASFLLPGPLHKDRKLLAVTYLPQQTGFQTKSLAHDDPHGANEGRAHLNEATSHGQARRSLQTRCKAAPSLQLDQLTQRTCRKRGSHAHTNTHTHTHTHAHRTSEGMISCPDKSEGSRITRPKTSKLQHSQTTETYLSLLCKQAETQAFHHRHNCRAPPKVRKTASVRRLATKNLVTPPHCSQRP